LSGGTEVLMLELAEIFRRHGAAYRAQQLLLPSQRGP
jgi:hypothetical protein